MKYYGTFGPSCHEKEMVAEMLSLGMTGMRLNLSHAGLMQCRDWIENYKLVQAECGCKADLLIDLKGPELRVGDMKKPQAVQRGEMVLLENTADIPESRIHMQNEKEAIPVPACVMEALSEGQEVLLNDGTVKLTVTEQSGSQAVCIAKCEGTVSKGKSIALPGIELALPTLTAEDLENLCHAEQFGVTEVMLPFVRGKEDIENLRSTLREIGADDIRIQAKIENQQGVSKLEEIIQAADSIVIARGDLGNAVPLWKLPGLQKQIAKVCRQHRKSFMVVTQLLHSMHEAPVPTRAEVCDIYNAVLDGADSLMITGETAAGRYPVEAMRYLILTGKEALRDQEDGRSRL